MVNNLHFPIPQVQDKNKGYTARNIKRADCVRRLQHITSQTIKLILNVVDNNILQNHPIVLEDVIMDEDIYRSRMLHLKGKTVWIKIQHVEPVRITSNPKTILGK